MTHRVGLISALVLSHLAVAGALAAPTTQSHRRAAPPNQHDGKHVDPRGLVAAVRPHTIRHAIKAADRAEAEGRRESLPTSSPDQFSPQRDQVSLIATSGPAAPAEPIRSHLFRHARKVSARARIEAPREPLPTGSSDQPSPQEEQVGQVDLPAPTGSPVTARSHLGHHAIKVSARAPVDPSPEPLPPISPNRLTAQEREVNQIAVQNGDQEFLMVDKPSGRVILFENGYPVLIGAALTGLSTADRLPPGALSEKFEQLEAPEDKVTPAGRFTITPGYDKEYGPLFDIKEVKGKDWAIAIHQVYLGTPSEHRAERIRSPNENDRHITFGCINVTPETMRVLVRELPKDRATPLYILPQDENHTANYFEQDNT